MNIRTVGATALLLMALGACGGSDNDEAASPVDSTPTESEATPSAPEETPSETVAPPLSGPDATAAKAIANSIMDSNDESLMVTRKEANCVGEGFVADIGADQLVEYGILTEDNKTGDGMESVKMSQEDAASAADVMLDCADVKGMFTGAMGDLPEEATSCLDERLTDDVLNEFFVGVFMGDEDAGSENLMTALTECMGAGG